MILINKKTNPMLHTHSVNRTVFILVILGIINLLSCKKKDEIQDVVQGTMAGQVTSTSSSLLSLTSFVLEKKYNTQLPKDVVFEIKGDTLFGRLKLSNAVATLSFTSNSQSIEIDGVAQVTGVSKIDFTKSKVLFLKYKGITDKKYVIKINWDNSVPHIYIDTESGLPVTSKVNYVKSNISIKGNNYYNDFNGTAQIRGRGNSTWTYPKIPYRIKLDTKASLFSLSPERDWVLLANYLDGTHLLNAVAMKIGHLTNMPFTNNIIPVEVTVNGEYQGCYMFTEQIEVENNRVNVGANGLLVELDTQYEDPWQFLTQGYNLPVLVKHPEVKNETELDLIKEQFENMEALVASENFPHTNYWNVIDDDALADYMMVQMLTGNEEINHPKSTYMHKTATGKYKMGPIWDFDWGFGFNGSDRHFVRYDEPLFWSPKIEGTNFFSKLMSDPYMKALLRDKWANFRNKHFDELMRFIDDYSNLISDARQRDHQKWQRGGENYEEEVAALKTWLKNRAYFMEWYIEQL
jgi:CotH kinase protein